MIVLVTVGVKMGGSVITFVFVLSLLDLVMMVLDLMVSTVVIFLMVVFSILYLALIVFVMIVSLLLLDSVILLCLMMAINVNNYKPNSNGCPTETTTDIHYTSNGDHPSYLG